MTPNKKLIRGHYRSRKDRKEGPEPVGSRLVLLRKPSQKKLRKLRDRMEMRALSRQAHE